MSVHRLTREDLLEYRAERGWTAISIEICPHDPVTLLIGDAALAEAVREFESVVIGKFDWTDPADYAGLRRTMADNLVPALATENLDQITNCAVVALWCALHHPRDGGLMQARMAHIRGRGLAPHFTICRGPQGAYGTSLGESYADLRPHLTGRIDPSHTILGVLP
jgi:hypothetical protein